MKKIPTLFVRDMTTRLVTDEVTPGCVWVFSEPNVKATRKWDGTCCLVRNKTLYKRQEIKPGKPIPPDFEEEYFDENTGKRFGWVPVGDGPIVDLPGKPYRDVLVRFFDQFNIEGIVFYGPNGERAKIKGKDFVIKRAVLAEGGASG